MVTEPHGIADLAPEETLWIDGGWTVDRQPLPVLDKYHGEEIGAVLKATPDDVDRAVGAAARGGRRMARLPAHQRAAVLQRAAETLEMRAELFAWTICREAGKPIALARVEVDRAVDTLRQAASEVSRPDGEVAATDAVRGGERYFGLWRRRPVGVVAAITPFNFPLNLVMHKVAPALAAGNAVVLKPSELTPLSAVLLCQTLLEAGLPAEAIQLLHGCGETVGGGLVAHPGVDLITFTGSAAVGRQISREAGLRRCALELGNNSPAIICQDADLEFAAARCGFGGFAFAGQMCISVQRVYIERPVYDRFRDCLVAAAAATVAGDPADEQVVTGPMITVRQADRIASWIDEACQAGAAAVSGRRREGSVHWPTVLEHVPADVRVVREEAFGPVVVIEPVADFTEAVARADDTAFGLQAGIFTRDLDRALDACDGLQFGGVVINDIPTVRLDHLPYGGTRGSGLGREGLRHAIEEMTEVQTILVRRRGGGTE